MIAIPALPKSSMPSTPTKNRVLELLTPEQTGDALATWKQLDTEHPTPHITASWPWVRAWIDAYGDVVTPRVVLWREGEAIVGCGLVVESTNRLMGRVPIRTVHLGTSGEIEPGGAWAEYVRPWVYRDHESAAFEEQLIAAASNVPSHRFDIDGIDRRLFEAVGFRADELESHTSFAYEFSKISRGSDIREQILAGLGKSTRKNVKRRLNKYPSLQVQWTDSANDQILDELIELHQARWTETNEAGSFAEHRFETFIRTFVRLAAGQDRYALSRVFDDEGTVGCQLLLREENRVQDYVAGFASTETRQSPGLICHFANIVEAARRNLHEYEFLIGDARVKRDLSNSSRDVIWAKQVRPTRRTRVLSAARRAYRFAKKMRAVTKMGAAT